jgi:cell filamentation protein
MRKDGFPFAAPQYIANNIANTMKEFEVNFLSKYTPCKFMKDDELAFALGVVHVEFIIIHPFRGVNIGVTFYTLDYSSSKELITLY